jgi:hypothetical protein
MAGMPLPCRWQGTDLHRKYGGNTAKPVGVVTDDRHLPLLHGSGDRVHEKILPEPYSRIDLFSLCFLMHGGRLWRMAIAGMATTINSTGQEDPESGTGMRGSIYGCGFRQAGEN